MALAIVSPLAPLRQAKPAEPVHGAADSDGSSFADLLGQSREASRANRAACRASREAAPDGAGDPAQAAQPAERRTDRPAEAPEKTEDETTGVEKAELPDDAAPVDPALAPWLVPLQQATAPGAPQPDAAADAGGAAAGGASIPGLRGPDTTGLLAPRPGAAVDAGADLTAAGADAPRTPRGATRAADAGRGDATDAATTSAATEPAAATAAVAAARPGPVDAPFATGTLGAPIAAPRLAEAPSAAAPTAAPAAAAIATPVENPAFAGALGVQVSVFARDGVQQAELSLNPAEMGPVSVQIALDGTQARVHFGAEVAATRAAIEASLPELAAALRDAGFTLSGGGVSQQRGGQGGDGTGPDGAPPRRGRTLGGADAADANGVTARVVPRRVALGGVDLYA